MMYVAYTSGYTLSRPDVASQVLRRAASLTPGRDKVVYWLAAIADFGLTRTQLLPQGVPVLAYVTYRLRRDFRPSALVAAPAGSAASLPLNTAGALALPHPIYVQDQGRSYLSGPQEAIYEELMAGRKRAGKGNQPALNLAPPTLAEITRGLAGWSTPQMGACPQRARPSAPTHGKRATRNSRHD